jgi:hypothetical protein
MIDAGDRAARHGKGAAASRVIAPFSALGLSPAEDIATWRRFFQ